MKARILAPTPPCPLVENPQGPSGTKGYTGHSQGMISAAMGFYGPIRPIQPSRGCRGQAALPRPLQSRDIAEPDKTGMAGVYPKAPYCAFLHLPDRLLL